MPWRPKIGAIAAGVLASGLTVTATASAGTPQQCTARWDMLVKTHQAGALSYQTFMAGCLSGRAPTPLPTMDAPGNAPPDATARCQDGTYTATMSRLAACEHHGGVAAMLRSPTP